MNDVDPAYYDTLPPTRQTFLKRPLGCRLGSHTHYTERKVNLRGCGREDCAPCRQIQAYTKLVRTCLLCGYNWDAKEHTGW